MKPYTILCFIFLFSASLNSQQIYKRSLMLMGCDFEVTVVADDARLGNQYIDMAVEEISRIEKLISSWNANSETTKINNNAGISPVKVNPELYALIERANTISLLTDGAFDISFASVDKLWKFDGTMNQMPDEQIIISSVKLVGYENIVLNSKDTTVFLTKKGMKIGFGAIGKGYAADMAKKLLLEEGVSSGIVNASGDINTWGRQPDGSVWQVAITNPLDKNKAFALLPVTDGAVVTSGSYEKFAMVDGKRYAHIINPKTGYPAEGIISVTIFAPQAELADALATSVFVMGKDVGLSLIDQLPNTECIIVDDNGNLFTSEHISIDK